MEQDQPKTRRTEAVDAWARRLERGVRRREWGSEVCTLHARNIHIYVALRYQRKKKTDIDLLYCTAAISPFLSRQAGRS